MRKKCVLALLLLPALAAAAGNAPRLERLQIDIWPEYDRPAALVILKAELAGSVDSPTPLTLRIPATSGGPSALAYSSQEAGQLLNLRHEKSAAGDFITLRFAAPARFFHVEFYDPLDTRGDQRSYRYLWPGDLPVEKLRVSVQEPAAASGLSVRPELAQWSAGPGGLRYRTAEFGPVAQGNTLSFDIGYAQSDPRSTVEIVEAGRSAEKAVTRSSPEERASFRLFVASVAVALLLAGSVPGYYAWRRRRTRAAANVAADQGYCPKCGHRPSAGDRYCANCGAAL